MLTEWLIGLLKCNNCFVYFRLNFSSTIWQHGHHYDVTIKIFVHPFSPQSSYPFCLCLIFCGQKHGTQFVSLWTHNSILLIMRSTSESEISFMLENFRGRVVKFHKLAPIWSGRCCKESFCRTYWCTTKMEYLILEMSGMSNWRPAGHMRPHCLYNAARCILFKPHHHLKL